MNKRNYQRELDAEIEKLQRAGRRPRLLLHSCCAPCSSYTLEYLSQYFEITVYFFNPNIFPSEEYRERENEQERLISEINVSYPVKLLRGEYRPEEFYRAAKGLEREPEGGARCKECFRLRLKAAAIAAKEGGFDFFTTTLTISPRKDADSLNAIGEELEKEEGVHFLPSDFKKKSGYQRSVELSAIHHLYRQDYCGCVYSLEERNRRQQPPS